mgnify:FL=1
MKQYTGVDFSDYAAAKLRQRFPEYRFLCLDITEGLGDLGEGSADMVVMIDVTQHIVDGDKFARAMENVRKLLKPCGTIILTSNLSESLKTDDFYVKRRPLVAYQKFFPDFEFSQPLPFNAKYIFSLQRKSPNSPLP